MAKKKKKGKPTPKKKAKKATKKILKTANKAAKKNAKPAKKKSPPRKVAKKSSIPSWTKGRVSSNMSLENAGAGLTLGESMVDVTYELTKTTDVAPESLEFGETLKKVNLKGDRDTTNPNKYKSKTPYRARFSDEALRVRLLAEGKIGGNWSLDVQVNKVALADNSIVESVDGNGRADHDQSHS